MKVIVILIMLFRSLSAPPSGAVAIFESEAINPFENLFKAVCQVESSGNRFAIGDKHLKEWSCGIAQIRQVRIDDYFRRTGIRYTTDDMFCSEKSREVFMHYASQNNPHDLMKIAKSWNGSGDMTIAYWSKIRKHLN